MKEDISTAEKAEFAEKIKSENIELSIKGMSCAACVKHVEIALKNVPGVLNAAVNLSSERASVVYQAGISSIERFNSIEYYKGKKIFNAVKYFQVKLHSRKLPAPKPKPCGIARFLRGRKKTADCQEIRELPKFS